MPDTESRGPLGALSNPAGPKSLAQDFHTPLVNKEPFDARSASKSWMTTQSCDQRDVPAVHKHAATTHGVTPVDMLHYRPHGDLHRDGQKQAAISRDPKVHAHK